MMGILFSCVNDLDTVQQVTYDPHAPDEVYMDLDVVQTDSGMARVRIYSKLAEIYSEPEEITQLKDGLIVDFYDADGEITSRLTALYGEIDRAAQKMFVRDSVELRNIEKEQVLQTEELHWNQKDSSVYTDKNVVVTTPDKIGYGKGIRTNQDFEFYTILKPSGKMDPNKKDEGKSE